MLLEVHDLFAQRAALHLDCMATLGALTPTHAFSSHCYVCSTCREEPSGPDAAPPLLPAHLIIANELEVEDAEEGSLAPGTCTGRIKAEVQNARDKGLAFAALLRVWLGW